MTEETPAPAPENAPVSAKRKNKLLLPAIVGGVVIIGAAALLMGGDIEGELKEGFAKKYDRDLCLSIATGYPFRGRGEDAKRLEALVDKGYLTRADAPPNPYEFGMFGPSYVFDITPEGKAKTNDQGQFCYGHAKVTEIVDYTEPTESSGKERVTAEARVEYDVTDDWAESPGFQNITKTGETTVKASFVKKRKAGWVIEDSGYGW